MEINDQAVAARLIEPSLIWGNSSINVSKSHFTNEHMMAPSDGTYSCSAFEPQLVNFFPLRRPQDSSKQNKGVECRKRPNQRWWFFWRREKINKFGDIKQCSSLISCLPISKWIRPFKFQGRACVFFEIFVNDGKYALSRGIFFRSIHFYFNGLPQYFN